MTAPLIFLVLGLGCLAWAIFLLSRRWTDLRLLDPLTIKEERHRLKREEMIRKRFERMRSERSQPLRRFSRSIARSFDSLYESLSQRLQAMEDAYGSGAKSPFSTIAPTTQERIKALLLEARSFVRDIKWSEAEKRFLEVLALDPHNVEAYKGLGTIYLKQKIYQQARDTFMFIVKMKKADDATYAALAEIEEAAGNQHEAELYRLQAVELGGKQACRHAELADFYLGNQDLLKAWSPVKRATELEPNSAKYAEQALEIAVLLGDATEARNRYQRFRLLSDDRSRFQYWREKVEALEASVREVAPQTVPATAPVTEETPIKKKRAKKPASEGAKSA